MIAMTRPLPFIGYGLRRALVVACAVAVSLVMFVALLHYARSTRVTVVRPGPQTVGTTDTTQGES